MRKSVLAILFADVLLLALVPLLLQLGPPSQFHVMAQSSFPDPTNEHACPSQTGAGGGAEAIPAFVGPGGKAMAEAGARQGRMLESDSCWPRLLAPAAKRSGFRSFSCNTQV